MTGELFIVDGRDIINQKVSYFQLLIREWQSTCDFILDSFTTKTSSVATDLAKNNVKEYTYWYQKSPDSSLKSFGKERPDIESMYPPKPDHPIQFQYQIVNNRHIIISDDDYENNSELFGLDCLIFPYSARISPGSSFVIMEAECL